MKRKSIIFILSTLILLSISCATRPGAPTPNTIYTNVYIESYQPRFEPSKYTEYRGKEIIFYSIDIEAPNVSNFGYYSEDGTYGYALYHKPRGWLQPVVSFFWYALQKSFTNIGIVLKDGGQTVNDLELKLKITSLTDQEAKFLVNLSRNGVLFFQKTITVSQKLPPSNNLGELEKRQYAFIDLIVDSILSDPDFKREFFSEKGKLMINK